MKKIISINKIGIEEVYDLEVKKNSNYIVGGSVLHNCGYRGEIMVILQNLGDKPFQVFKGDRVAQMVVAQVVKVPFEKVKDLSESDRGTGGFGSTGV